MKAHQLTMLKVRGLHQEVPESLRDGKEAENYDGISVVAFSIKHSPFHSSPRSSLLVHFSSLFRGTKPFVFGN
jgi:hypothetical protein